MIPKEADPRLHPSTDIVHPPQPSEISTPGPKWPTPPIPMYIGVPVRYRRPTYSEHNHLGRILKRVEHPTHGKQVQQKNMELHGRSSREKWILRRAVPMNSDTPAIKEEPNRSTTNVVTKLHKTLVLTVIRLIAFNKIKFYSWRSIFPTPTSIRRRFYLVGGRATRWKLRGVDILT